MAKKKLEKVENEERLDDDLFFCTLGMIGQSLGIGTKQVSRLIQSGEIPREFVERRRNKPGMSRANLKRYIQMNKRIGA